MAIPKDGYFSLENGTIWPCLFIHERRRAVELYHNREDQTGKRGRLIRAYGKTIENAIADVPDALRALKLHYLRWVLFNIGKDTYFMYQGIFDTDFDKYTEDADEPSF